MVCFQRWFRCFLLLVLYSAVYQGIFIQPIDENQITGLLKGRKNTASKMSLRKICNTIRELRAGPNNMSTEEDTLCSDDLSSNVPVIFPPKAPNGTKIVKCKVILDSPILKKTEINTNTSNCTTVESIPPSVIIVEPTTSSVNANLTSVDTTEVKSNNSNISSNEVKIDNSNVNTTDIKCDNTKLTQNTVIQSQDDNVNTSNFNYNETNSNKTDTETGTKLSFVSVKDNVTISNSSKIDTEVPDLLDFPDNHLNLSQQVSEPPPNISLTKQINTDTDWIEDGENTEDMRNSNLTRAQLSMPGVSLVQGQLAAILAGVFVSISVIAYVGMLSWRRYLENRYGNRQMLVNEEEFNDDLRYFSI